MAVRDVHELYAAQCAAGSAAGQSGKRITDGRIGRYRWQCLRDGVARSFAFVGFMVARLAFIIIESFRPVEFDIVKFNAKPGLFASAAWQFGRVVNAASSRRGLRTAC